MKCMAVFCLKVALTVLLSSIGAFACQPCQSTLTLEQSAAKAELIIVGQRPKFSRNEVRPESIKVRVVSILRANPRKKLL
jgi:hypothetical protein